MPFNVILSCFVKESTECIPNKVLISAFRTQIIMVAVPFIDHSTCQVYKQHFIVHVTSNDLLSIITYWIGQTEKFD